MIDSILKSFEVWSDAQGVKSKARVKNIDNISLEGLIRLRELILEMAIRGKLIPQEPKDEPSSVLLKKIKSVNDELVKEGKLKKIKPLPEIQKSEYPFHLPAGWEYVRLNDIGEWGSGATPNRSNSNYFGGDIPWFKSGELNGDFIENSEEHITALALKQTSLRYNNVGDVLIAMYGATIGKTSILKVRATTNQAVCACTTFLGISNKYLLTLLKAYQNRFTSMGVGGAQPNISREKIINTVIALPPSNEQQRIVSKVEELMAVCDKLEEEKKNNLKTHQYLVSCLLETLTNSFDADALRTSWEKISQQFDTLFCTEDSIEQLKGTLLQLVIRGKFGTQNENDIPAKELFEKIEEELTEKFDKSYSAKLSRDKSTLDPSAFHFAIPKNWIWCELQDLAILFNGKAHEQLIDEKGKYILINSSFVSSEGRVFKTVSSQLTPLTKGDIAIVMSDVPDGNALVKCYLVKEDNKFSLNQRIGGISTSQFLDINYLLLVLNRNKYYLQYNDGRKQSNLKKIQILSCPIALPPFEEQQRIVEKVADLFVLCDSLKTKIEKANEINLSLSKTILELI
ncbi:restriction endonuclease subunit S [Flavobacterium sp.]|uniref:restriction endonuclease subunit S n=1 Tax=Flavobacterium sp. TaxID=239 RepID=UPI003BCB78F8